MDIVGIQESFIDYPNHICIMIFTRYCKWNCPHCHNKNNLMNAESLSKSYVNKYLEESKSLTNYVTISGGEPTDDSGLLSFVSNIKKLGYYIKLDTTGYNPNVLKEVLPYLSVVAMDVKELPSDFDKYHRISNCSMDQFRNVNLSLSLLSDWSKSEDNTLILRTTLFDTEIVSDDIKDYLDSNGYHYDKYIVQKDLL